MPRAITNRRSENRCDLPRFLDGRVHLSAPDGTEGDFLLVDLSLTGVCFQLESRLNWVTPESIFEKATIKIGSVTLTGGIRVLHVYRGDGPGYSCGAQFFPKGEEDRNELIGLLTRLEALPKR